MSATAVERFDINVEHRNTDYNGGRFSVIEISFRAWKENVLKVDSVAIEDAIKEACDKYIETKEVEK